MNWRMKKFTYDIAVIGGGPAGLAAALEAKRQGIEKVIIIERDIDAGGILRQCVHDGFGLQRFGKRMSGGQYAQHFLDELKDSGVDLLVNAMVLQITQDKRVYAVSETAGMMEFECGALILTMGCRERTRSQAFILGTRPSGVMTAGVVQRYINIDGYLPGKKAVILGSGDIGLIMARRMTLEGMTVEGVYEVEPNLGGLRRNVVQCLDDFGIPLHLSTTVTQIYGEKRLEGVTVSKIDGNRNPIPSTDRYISCDLLVLAVGLIPENELSIQAGIELDPMTKGPVVDESYMTSVEGIFAAGNVVAVFDLVDYVSMTGEIAARSAARYLKGQLDVRSPYLPLQHNAGVRVLLPQRIRTSNLNGQLSIFLRVTRPMQKAELRCIDGETCAYYKQYEVALPPEMIFCQIPSGETFKAPCVTVEEKAK